MSGAFSIDIEVGNFKSTYRIHCSSLTHQWVVDKRKSDIQALIQDFNHSKDVRKYLPKEPDFNIKDMTERNRNIQIYFGSLACTARILRHKPFHDFLQLPEPVRDSLIYCHDRGGQGRVIKQGKIFLHNSFIPNGQREVWITLSEFERSSNLSIKLHKDDTQIFSALKIGRSASIHKFESKEESKDDTSNSSNENILIIKSGEKARKLKCIGSKEFKQWYQTLNQQIKKAGGKVDENDPTMKRASTVLSLKLGSPKLGGKKKGNKDSPDQLAKTLQLENVELRKQLQELNEQSNQMINSIEDLRNEKDNLSSNQNQLRRQIKKTYEDIKQNQINRYELEHEKLRTRIEELHRKLEIKTMKEGGFKGILRLFSEGYEVPSKNINNGDDDLDVSNEDFGDDTYDLIEFEEKQKGQEVNDADIKWEHKHLHKHEHKNIYHHRHTHIHDDTQTPSVVYTQTHTVAHTICHTHTELKIKRKFL